MASHTRALIVGGGIAGMCTALGLSQAGFAVDLVEKNPKWDVYGAGILLAANALRALDQLGLAERVIAAGYPSPTTVLWAPDGTRLGEVTTPPIEGTTYPSILGIARPALHRVLQEAVRSAGINVRVGTTIERLEEEGDAVQVAFADGERGRYDLVIGADGLRSQVRQLIFPEVPTPRYEDQVVWRYPFSLRPPELTTSWIVLGDPKVGIVPTAPDAVYIFITEAAPGKPLRFADEQLADAMRERVMLYQHIPLLRLLAEHLTEPSRVVLRPFETVLVPHPWYRGRIVLVGDAAHTLTAHTAQGGAMAIEDAVVLVQELRDTSDVEKALHSYSRRRFERVRRMFELSLQICMLERTHDPRTAVESARLMAEAHTLAAMPI